MEINNLFKNGYTIFNNVVEKDEVDKVLIESLKLPLFSKNALTFKKLIKKEGAPYQAVDVNSISYYEDKDSLTLDRFRIKDIIRYDDYQVLQHQSWYWTDIHTVYTHWAELIKKIINKLQETYKNHELSYEDNHITLHVMPPGSFIEHHDDGIVKNRLGAFILPLHQKPLRAHGGDLVISNWTTPTRQIRDIIESNVGDMVVLDFTENNTKHEVTIVENWIRLSLVGFFFSKGGMKNEGKFY